MSLPKFIALSCVFSVTSASGVLWLKMINFDNPNGEGDNGHPCDGKFIFTLSKCDHKFKICIDNAYGSRYIGSCSYGTRQTTRISNKDRITFGSFVGGIRNPMTFPFTTWPGKVKIKVEIWDDDKNNNPDDYVEFLSKVFSSSPSSRSAYGERLTLQRRTKLQLQVKVYCDTNYYGYDCGTYCRQRYDRYGHYTCHWRTGAKICRKGWMGRSCQIQNFCSSAPCNNNGVCVNLEKGFFCTCTDRFTGITCADKATPDRSTLITSTTERSKPQNQSSKLKWGHLTETNKEGQQSDKLKVDVTEKHEDTTVYSNNLEVTMAHDDTHDIYSKTAKMSIVTESLPQRQTFAIIDKGAITRTKKGQRTVLAATFVTGGVILVSAFIVFVFLWRKKKNGNSSKPSERKSEIEESRIYEDISEYDRVKSVPKSSSYRCSENIYYIAPPQSTSKNSAIPLVSKQDVQMRQGGNQNHESEIYDDFVDIGY